VQGFSSEKLKQAIAFYKDHASANNEAFEAYLNRGGAALDPPRVSSSVERTSSAIPESQTLTEVPDSFQRSIAFEWEGMDRLLVGEILFKRGQGGGTFTVAIPDRSDNQCTGTYKYKTRTEGLWSMGCTDGRAASGTFIAHGQEKGSSGTGTDTNGKFVKFTVGSGRK